MDKLLIGGSRRAEILLIDDNRGDALLAQHAFRDSTVDVNLTIASTGEMAMAILHQQGENAGRPLPDVILLDLGLPQMSGMDVLTAVKTDERLKHIPVVVMSNSGNDHNISKCYRLHASAYVIKPTDVARYRETMGLIEKFFFVLATLPVAAAAMAEDI